MNDLKKEKKLGDYEVIGTYNESLQNKNKKFNKIVKAFNETHAADKVLALIGSKHKTSRRQIKITEVKKAKELK